MTRINDVAELARVSPATVSRVLNNVPTVDQALAKRVRTAAEALGYRPNGVARNLRRQRADVIALIVSDVANPFFTAVVRGAEDAAQVEGFSVLLCNTDEDPGKETQYLEVAEQEKVSGVVLSPNHKSSDVSRLQSAGIAVCIIDRWLGAQFDTVRADSRAAADTATGHLFDEGWERPACLTGPSSARTALDRRDGYLDAYQARRRRKATSLVRYTDFRAEQAGEATASLLDGRRPPDSFFVANSSMALGVLSELARRRLRPGRDVGVVAMDDAPWTQLVSPPLTVVAQPAYEIGRRSVEMLLRRVHGPADHPGQDVIVPTRLVVRESSRRPARRTTRDR